MLAIVGLIIYLIAYSTFLYSYVYSSRRINVWYYNANGNKYREELWLRKPSIRDLDLCNDSLDYRYKVEDYTEKVIKPSQDYFTLRKKLETLLEPNNQPVFIIALTSFCPISGFLKFIIPNKLILMIIFVFVTAGIIPVILFLLSRRTIPFKEFCYSEEELKMLFHRSNYNVSKEDDFNNFMISKHYEYLKEIENYAYKANSCKKYCDIVSCIMFFMGVPLGYILLTI